MSDGAPKRPRRRYIAKGMPAREDGQRAARAEPLTGGLYIDAAVFGTSAI